MLFCHPIFANMGTPNYIRAGAIVNNSLQIYKAAFIDIPPDPGHNLNRKEIFKVSLDFTSTKKPDRGVYIGAADKIPGQYRAGSAVRQSSLLPSSLVGGGWFHRRPPF
jgi:hypothetical protein